MSQVEMFGMENFRVCDPESCLKDVALSIRPCSIADVSGFIEAHYLHSRPAIVHLCLLVHAYKMPCGACVFSEPPPETSVRYGGITWELARLYLKDEVPPNAESWVISRSVREIRRSHRHVRFLVSYADPGANHSGTIYRACGWKYDGMTDEERLTPRCDYFAAGKKYSRRSHIPNGVIVNRIPRISKHRFVLAL